VNLSDEEPGKAHEDRFFSREVKLLSKAICRELLSASSPRNSVGCFSSKYNGSRKGLGSGGIWGMQPQRQRNGIAGIKTLLSLIFGNCFLFGSYHLWPPKDKPQNIPAGIGSSEKRLDRRRG
jgi:hypothetical protein